MFLFQRPRARAYAGRRRSSSKMRFIGAAVVAAIALITYFSNSVKNPITGKTQHISMTVDQEIALGLQAAPEMAQQFGGLHPDTEAQALVDHMGRRLVAALPATDTPYPFEFHLLADPSTINAFALPGGQIFITAGLMDRLETQGQLAGVLGHEVGHVVGRHSAARVAKAQLTQGLTGAAVIASYDPNNPSTRNTAAVAMVVGQLVNMKYGRDDELESDYLGVRFLADAGYDPNAMIRVMEILGEAGKGRSQPEFFSTHPNPENRIGRIKDAIAQAFPSGLPPGLEP